MPYLYLKYAPVFLTYLKIYHRDRHGQKYDEIYKFGIKLSFICKHRVILRLKTGRLHIYVFIITQFK